MPETKCCPKCGANLPDKAARGLCPKCLLSVGLDATSGVHDSKGATIASGLAASGSAPRSAPIGESVRYFGDYELLEEIARGGMGVVYKARQSSLKRIVAVKMILSGHLASDVDVQRFHGEAEAAANLQHPHIVAIHEVGEHGGQHYFSMEYVAGRNLADVVRDSTLPPEQAAACVATIARAVHYAHEQGVLHRDLKPSNILVQQDESGSTKDEQSTNADASTLIHPLSFFHLKITDFGLAKRIEGGAEMTATGQALGTPSYMSPEQATGKRNQIGPPSDVYSMGAILYELITGRPPFRAATALDTIMLVLDQHPVRPGLLNPKVPKDLETICLKCLEKDASRRYATAGALADDVQRFLQGEPIDARPAGVAERSWRWLRKQRRSVALGTAAVAITAVLGTAGLAGWFWYQNWRLGYVSIRSNKPPIVAEIMDQDDQSVMPAFAVPTPVPVSLPADAYQLRLSAPGRMSQTYHTAISRTPRKNHFEFNLNLEDQLLNPTISIERTYELVNLEGPADLILIDDAGLQRFRGTEVRYPVWTLNIVRPEHDPVRATIPVAAELASLSGLRWPWSLTDRGYTGPGKTHWRPRLVARVQSAVPTRQAPDLDGDDVGDLVIAAQHQAWLLAVSGGTGKVLWIAGRGDDLHDRASQSEVSRIPSDEIHSAVLGTPRVVEDMNADGVVDLVATFANLPDGNGDAPRYWVELVSGASGDTIWKFEVDNAWLQFSQVTDVPPVHEWITKWASFGQNGGARYWNHEQLIRERREIYLHGTSHEAPIPAELVMLGKPHVLLIAGTRMVVLDCANGKQVPSVADMEFLTQRLPMVMDVDHDMHSEVLFVQQQQSSGRRSLSPQMRVVAWSISNGRLLWEHTMNAELSAPPHWSMNRAAWPAVEDLDNDGFSEIILPSGTSMGSLPRTFGAWGAIQVLDGTDGSVRWEQRIKTMDLQLDHFAVGPDIDGDGQREVFVATLLHRGFDLYVDALSGKDGRKLWWSTKKIGREVWLNGLQWWHPARDGWPQLLVSITSERRDDDSSTVFAFSAGTGRLIGEGEYLDDVRVADGNADGIPDLYGLQPRKSMNLDFGGKLYALRGSAGEMWRWIGGDWTTGKDYDGDGHADGLSLLRCAPSNHLMPPPALVAVSGRSGRPLWRAQLLDQDANIVRALDTDLDGDAAPDVLVTHAPAGGYSAGQTRKFPLEAISGRDGSRLWLADVSTNVIEGTLLADSVDLEQNGHPDVIFAGSLDWQQFGTTRRQFRHWLAVLSGRTGKVRWKQPISAPYGIAPSNRGYTVDASSLQPAYADLDNDGVLDIVLLAQNAEMPEQMELRSVSGRDGSSIWARPLANSSAQKFLDGPVPVCGDLESDGTQEVLVLEYLDKPDAHGVDVRYARLLCLDAMGRQKWVWETPVHADCGRTNTDPDRLVNKPRPFLVATDDHRTWICLGLWGRPGEVVLIDSHGELVAKTPVDSHGDDFRPHVIDLNGDGRDEILLHNKEEIVVLRPVTQLQRLWQWPVPEGGIQRLVDVLPASSGKEAVIAVQSDRTMFGLSGSDGRLLWSCPGPAARTDQGLTGVPTPMGLLPSGEGAGNKAEERSVSGNQLSLPLVAIHLANDITVCRQVSPTGSGAPIGASSFARYRRAATTTPAAGDRRLLKTSPFKIPDHERDKIVATVTWGTTLAALLVIMPIGYLSGLIRHRVWSLRRLLLLPLVAGIALLAMRFPAPPEVTEPSYVPAPAGRLIIACQFAPVLVFLGLLIQNGRRKKWKHVTVIITLALVVGILPAAALLIAASQTLGPGERFTWDGWYVPLLIGCYLAGCAVTLAILLRWAYRAARALLQHPKAG